MKSIEFANRLKSLCEEALQGVDKKEIEPSNIIGVLTIQTVQLTNMFTQLAFMRQQQERPKIFVPGPMQKSPPPISPNGT